MVYIGGKNEYGDMYNGSGYKKNNENSNVKVNIKKRRYN